MSACSQALVPLSTEQQAAWRAVAETENAAIRETRWRNIRMRGRFSAV